jgi:hypothetical protein
METIICKTCDKGEMVRKKIYRMNGPAVVIGYILLIPSILGMCIGLLLLFAAVGGTNEVAQENRNKSEKTLASANIPYPLIRKVVYAEKVEEVELSQLSPLQRETIKSVAIERDAGSVGSKLAGAAVSGVSVILIISSFVGGLLGWILVMKKMVLQCNNCRAVVQAS